MPTEDGTAVRRCACWMRRLLADIPRRFAGASFEGFASRTAAQQRAYQVMSRRPGGSYYLHGVYARGKTHLLYAQYRALLQAGKRAFVRSTKQIIDELTDAELDRGFSPLLEAVKGKARIHLLWDDADKLKPTEFKHEVLYDLVDKLYRHEHGLTVTSNLDLAALPAVLGEAMVRRIDDLCEEVIEL